MNKHVSLKDLAKELGVSISTVSRALRNHPDIGKDLTEKIQRLAAQRNYSPNPLALGLLKQKTRIIGVIVPDIVTHFYASVISGIEEIAQKHGYYIVIASSSESVKKEQDSVANLLKTRVEGFIICLSQETQNLNHFEELVKAGIPLVFFDRVAENIKVPQVTVDGMKAACKITKHFFENGYRRIAYISGPPYLNISIKRKEGYLLGLKNCNLPFIPELLIECNLSAADASSATKALLENHIKPDAIFGINDTVAFAAMKEIKKKGLKIPDDIGLVGFTDEFHSTVVDPTLTSVTHPTLEMGKEAARLFFNRLEYGTSYNQQVELQADLIIRESSIKRTL